MKLRPRADFVPAGQVDTPRLRIPPSGTNRWGHESEADEGRSPSSGSRRALQLVEMPDLRRGRRGGRSGEDRPRPSSCSCRVRRPPTTRWTPPTGGTSISLRLRGEPAPSAIVTSRRLARRMEPRHANYGRRLLGFLRPARQGRGRAGGARWQGIQRWRIPGKTPKLRPLFASPKEY